MLFFAEAVQVFGVPKSVGQIYGLLYASPVPLGFPDIVDRLEMSKGSASQGLQLLRSLGAITVADGTKSPRNSFDILRSDRPPKSRVERSVVYEPELSLRKLVSGVLRERIGPMAATSTERLARLRELAAEAGAEESIFFLDRARQLNSWRRRLKTVLPVLSALLGPKK